MVKALDTEHAALKEAATTSIAAAAAAAAATEDGDVEQRDNEVGTPVYAAQPQPIYAAPYPIQYQPVHFVPGILTMTEFHSDIFFTNQAAKWTGLVVS